MPGIERMYGKTHHSGVARYGKYEGLDSPVIEFSFAFAPQSLLQISNQRQSE